MAPPRVHTIEYRHDLDGRVVFTEPMIFRRLYAVGQGLVLDSVDYVVKSVEVVAGVQRVVVEGAKICRVCGGVIGPDCDEVHRCVCRENPAGRHA